MDKIKDQLKKKTTWAAISVVGVLFAVPPETIETAHALIDFILGA